MPRDLPTPTGTAHSDLLDLELAEPSGQATAATPCPAPGRTRVEVGPNHPFGPASVGAYDPLQPADQSPEQPGSRGEHLLQCAYGSRGRAQRFYADQMLDHLNEEMAAFVSRMEMAFVATADAHGECDSSLRAGPAGFLQVLDERRIAYPEYRGNGVLASLGNISENPHVGILMVDFVRDLIGLHVNGRARIVEDVDLRAERPGLPVELDRGRKPERWVVVEVEEAYVHCRKHVPRMQPVPRTRDWGTDDARRKGGDYFAIRNPVRAGQ